MQLGFDLTEQEFDAENARVTALFKADGIDGDTYATKSNQTDKGYWMQLVLGYEKYFLNSQYTLVEYLPKEDNETITIEL
jgi:hypothetical protein